MKQLTTIAAAVLALGATMSHAAPLVDLNTAQYITFGNVNSYSMPANGINIQSSPGQIKDQVIIYTGANGQDVTTNVAGFDDAYGAPNGTKEFAAMNTASNGGVVNMTDPGNKAGITNNNSKTWDANLQAMKDFLDGDTALFLFNNNDTNADQSLAIWAKIWITDAANAVYSEGGHSGYLYLSNRNQAYGAGGIFGPNGTASTYDAGGNITNPTTGLAATDFVEAGGNVFGFNHNLGANNVAYAGDIPLLNQWMSTLFTNAGAGLGGYSLHIELRLGCDPDGSWTQGTGQNKGCLDSGVKIDNGYEQLFLVRNDAGTGLLSAPGSLVLGLIGIAGLAGLSTRRRRG